MAATSAVIGSWMSANAGILAAASLAASVASTASQYLQQSQTAKAQAQYQEQQNLLTRQNAALSYDDLSPTEIDLQRQAADQGIQQQAEAAKAKGRVNVFAAASGTYGQSVDTMLFDTESIQARNINQILQEREAGLYNVRQQGEQIRQGAISSQSNSAISRPSWLEAGLNIGSAALSAYDKYSTKQATIGQLNKVKGGV